MIRNTGRKGCAARPRDLRRRAATLGLLALLAASCAGCSLSIGVTNSPPAPNTGAGPSTDRR